MARVTAIYRYPVKSMMGESLKRADVADAGIPGDRAWAVRDEKFGGIKGAKRFPALMQCTARYIAPPSIDERSAPAAITLPDGTQTSTADGAINAKLTHALGRDVTLWPLLSASAKDHFKRGNPAHPDAKAEVRRLFGREQGEALPDLSQFPKELFEYESPPGTYFDAYPIMILSTTAMQAMQQRAPESNFDVRRFRPNIVVDGDEQAWCGKQVSIGTAVLAVELPCPRCIMTTIGFADLEEDPQVLRTIIDAAGGNLGVYAKVVKPGAIAAGDEVIPG